LTGTGQILGTPSYMPPEQAAGKVEDVREPADVYALGAVLYAMLTGRPPFQADNPIDTLMQVLEREPVAPRQLNPKVPIDLETICLKCLEKSPHRRYESADALVAEMDRFLDGRPILARPVSRTQRAWRWCKRNPTVASLLAAVILSLATGAVVSTQFAVRASEREEEAVAEWTRAETNEKKALNLAQQEANSRRQIQFQAARLLFEQGWLMGEQGNTRNAMLLMARSLINLELLQRTERNPGTRALSEAASLSHSIRAHLLQRALRASFPGYLFAHDRDVVSVAFSPDGTKLATGSLDRTGRLWDVATGKPLGDSLQHLDPVRDSYKGVTKLPTDVGWCTVAFSPDGTKLATAGDYSARLWDLVRDEPLGDALQHAGTVTALAFSPDGTKLATGSFTAQLWDVTTGKPIGGVLQAGSVSAVAFSPDGTKLATASFDKTALIWDAATGKPIGVAIQHEGSIHSVAFSPDGTKLATASFDQTARLWDVATHRPVGHALQHAGPVRTVSFSPDGTKLATASEDQTARVWEVTTGKPLGDALQHSGPVRAVAFSPDGTKLATGSFDRTARLWDAVSCKAIGDTLQHSGSVNSLAFSPDGTKLATGCGDQTARLWDVVTGNPMGAPLQHSRRAMAVAFSPDGTKLATASFDQTARVWDVATRRPVGNSLQHAGPVMCVAFSPDGTKIATGSSENTAHLWDVPTGKLLGDALRHKFVVYSVAFSPDGTKLATGSGDHSARFWDVTTCKPLGDALEHLDQVYSVAFSPDGTKLATGSGDHSARFWDVASGKPIGCALEHASGVKSVAFSPDGTTLATGSIDGTRLWDVATVKPIGDVPQAGSVSAVAFSPDGTKLATASFDKTARFWAVATGKPIGDAIQHEDSIYALAFSPDGTKVATASEDGTARLWDVPGELVEPEQQVYLWVETVTGATVSDVGVFRQLNADELLNKQDELRKLGGPPRSWRAALDKRHELYRISLTKLPGDIPSDDWQSLHKRGELHAHAGKWKEAASDFAAAIRAHPDEHWLWYQSAGIWLMVGDFNAYRRHCQKLLDRFGRTDDPVVAERTAKACLLITDGAIDLAPIVRLAEQAITGTEEHPFYRYFLFARGLAHYRAGEFARAVERLEKCVTPDNPTIACDGSAYLVLAMAHRRLGHADDAAQSLAKARKTIDVATWPVINSGDLGDSWHDVVMIHILRREAEALLEESGDKPVK
jgi:WD40 repeat protein